MRSSSTAKPARPGCRSASGCRTGLRLIAVLDNLGKGASGAAVQNLNLMLGLDEAAGL
jgi:N-acetyl-gamma-glutamylphosphate reductase